MEGETRERSYCYSKWPLVAQGLPGLHRYGPLIFVGKSMVRGDYVIIEFMMMGYPHFQLNEPWPCATKGPPMSFK